MAVDHGEKPSVRLDLGCGTAKCPGFVGADRLPLAGVDVIVDLDMPLPFRSDSAHQVLLSHSLEHVRDLLATLKEVYRICRHGAQVCVVAPYSHQGLYLANPFHVHAFNEHTPRFWTDSQSTQVEPSDPGIDFRCVSMEFFYFPEYRNLSPDQQRAARKKYLDVCDQIMYQLVVVKKELTEIEIRELGQRTRFFEPPDVTLRKSQERIVALEAELHTARAEVAEASAELAAARQLVARANENAAAAEARADDTRARLGEASRRLVITERRLALWQYQARAVSTEAGAMRHGRFLRVLSRFRPGPDLSPTINPAFQDLLDDSHLFFGDLRGYRLQSSEDLKIVRSLTYRLRLDRPNLTGLILAPISDLPDETGSLGIELVTPDGSTAARARISLSEMEPHRPVRFVFPPVESNARSLELRVEVRDTATPVRLFEWRKRRFFGLGRPATRPFCAFIFE